MTIQTVPRPRGELRAGKPAAEDRSRPPLQNQPTPRKSVAGMRRLSRYVIILAWIALAAYPLLDGFDYYRLPLSERAFADQHVMYKPSGLIGQGLGIFGSLLIIVGVASYSLRKRWRRLERLGKLRTWLAFHVFVCTLGPYLILLHTTLKIGNIASIAFWSMAVVVVSGVFGRYVYAHIPKTPNGRFFSEQDVRREQATLVSRVSSLTGLDADEVAALTARFRPPPVRGFWDALWRAVRQDLGRARLQRALQRHLVARGVPAVAVDTAVPALVSNARFDQQRQLAGPFQRAFGYWHVLHLPLAFVMLVTFIVHVAVAIAFGYTWIF